MARLSVIIPAYRAQATLPVVLAALEPQVRADPSVETIVVLSGAEQLSGRPDWMPPWPEVVAIPQRMLPGAARNLGARSAHGTQLVFLDADAVPAEGWLDRLRRAADRTPGASAVAGAVANGSPRHAVGTSAYLVEFSEFQPNARRTPRHAASANLLIDRSAFDAAGGFHEDVLGEDTILTLPWGKDGRLVYARDAVVTHLNRTRFGDFLAHQFRLGRAFVVVCDRAESPHRRFSRWPLLPAAGVLRLIALAPRVSAAVAPASTLVRCPPLITAGLASWTLGVAVQRFRPQRGFGGPRPDSP